MTAPFLTVIGIGDGGLATLTPEARTALNAADVVFGGARHLSMLDGSSEGHAVTTGKVMPASVSALVQRRIVWKSPFRNSLGEIEAQRPKRVAILASGDPSWFGVAGTLSTLYGPEAMRVLPSPSSFSLAEIGRAHV